MPEGDTIFRAARTLHRALAGQPVTRFQSVFPRLTRIDDDTPLAGRTVERVEARGKHLVMWFSGGLALRTHMRMNGSWHIYRPGERWQRPRHEMRIVIETPAMHAVAFSVPVAEFHSAESLERAPALATLGPDVLADDFDEREAVTRILARGEMEIADALLDQSAIAGIGNIYKSEVLFAGRVNPFLPVREVGRDRVEELVRIAVKLMRAYAAPSAPTSGRFVYGRGGKPCRRCGTPISRRTQGPNVRSTYWCERCQAR